MMKNHHLAQAIGDVGFYEFKRQLLYKASWYGARVILADRWEPSSRRCSGCGWLDADLTLSDRTFHCEQCGLVLDRDLNAAINLEKLAGSFLGQPKRLWSRQRRHQSRGWCATVCETRATCPQEAGTATLNMACPGLGKFLRTVRHAARRLGAALPPTHTRYRYSERIAGAGCSWPYYYLGRGGGWRAGQYQLPGSS
jgi:hypothetical protein